MDEMTKQKWYHIDKVMIPSKAAFFFNGSKRTAILPFLALYFKSIGLSIRQTGVILAASYAGRMFGNVFFGIVADKTHAHRILLVIMGLVSVALNLSSPFVSASIGLEELNQCPVRNITLTSNETVKYYKNGDNFKLGSLMALLFFFLSFFGDPIESFMDSGVIEKIKTDNKVRNYGHQYYFSMIGLAIGSLISERVLHVFPAVNVSCYLAVFIAVSVFTLGEFGSALLVYRGVKPRPKPNENEPTFRKKLYQTLKKFDVIMFMLTVFIQGVVQSIFRGYLFIFLNSLNGSNLLLSLTVLLGAIAGAIFTFFNTKIIKLFHGTFNCMLVSTVVWMLRFIIFYFLKNPWLVLPFQVLAGLSSALFAAIKSEHLKKISSLQIHTTMFGIVSCLHFGISPIIGSFLGGYVYQEIGARKLFLIIATLAGFWSTVLAIYLVIKAKFLKNISVTLN